MNKLKVIFPVSADNIENLISDRMSGQLFIKNLLMTLDRIDCERDTETFIDIENKNTFIADYQALESLLDVRIGSYDLETTINQYISSNSIRTFIENPDEAFEEVVLISAFSRVDSLFTQKNQSRVLNRNDFRHCENHPKRIPSKSPLIGGTNGFDNAQEWLPSAIGDSKTQRRILINIDASNQNFIVRFEDENFNNQYHAYHIVKRENGQYIADKEELNLIKSSRKGIPRAFKLIEYRTEQV